MDNRSERLILTILKHEGGYVNDPQDLGGETYRGITKRSFPNWEGWVIVDKYKPLKTGHIIKDNKLEELIKNFYYKNFYTRYNINNINNILVAAHVLDHCVNAGGKNGVKILQKAINKVLNINIAVDGIIGKQTLNYANGSNSNEIAIEVVNQRKLYYQSIANSRPANKKFLNGWLRRVDSVTAEYGMVYNSSTTAMMVNKDNNNTESFIKTAIDGIAKLIDFAKIFKS